MSPGTDLGDTYLAVNLTVDHNQLCALDVLGLEDIYTPERCPRRIQGAASKESRRSIRNRTSLEKELS